MLYFYHNLSCICISVNSVRYSSSETFFCTINNISISAKTSIFTLVFFKAACYTSFAVTKRIFQDTYFESFQIHLSTIMCCFEPINHGVLLKILFQNLYKF